MTRRFPVVATLLVAVAVAGMIALGLWQLLDRRPQKLAYLGLLAANPAKPAVAYPRGFDPALLFRRVTARCAPPVANTLTGAGADGFRVIARCQATDRAPGAIVQLGTTHDPLARVDWGGGPVSGYLGEAPDARPLIVLAFSRRPPEPMIVADPPLAGLAGNERPDPTQVPNNHLSYAVQWFLFAATALVIYVLALRGRWRAARLAGPERRR